jgi:hypothetical protein
MDEQTDEPGTDRERTDPQDHRFGVAAARDQDRVDRLDDDGATEEELPEESGRDPRAAGKAEPA